MVTVEQVQQALSIIEQQPELRQAFRQVLLTEELLALPQRLTEFAETTEKRFRTLEVRIDELAIKQDELAIKQDELGVRQDELAVKQDELAIKQDELGVRQDELAVKQDELAAKFDGMTARQDNLEAKFDVMIARQDRMQDDLNALRGYALERKLSSSLRQKLVPLLNIRRTQVLWLAEGFVQPPSRVEEYSNLLEDSLNDEVISEDQYERLQVTDMIVRAFRQSDNSRVYIAVEASGVIRRNDIDRVRASAEALKKMFDAPVYSVVYGFSISDDQLNHIRPTGELDEVHLALDTDTDTD